MASIFSFKCSSCGELHEGAPSFGYRAPDPYLDQSTEVQEAGTTEVPEHAVIVHFDYGNTDLSPLCQLEDAAHNRDQPEQATADNARPREAHQCAPAIIKRVQDLELLQVNRLAGAVAGIVAGGAGAPGESRVIGIINQPAPDPDLVTDADLFDRFANTAVVC